MQIKKFRGSILLVVVSLLLILSFGSYLMAYRSILASKILANKLDNQEAFSIAEEALLTIEHKVIPYLSVDVFNSSCSNGYCFSGVDKELPQTCIINNKNYWQQAEYWQTEGYHQTLSLNYKNQQVTAKYIIDFLCYIPKNTDGPLADYNKITDMSMVFRITVLGINNNGTESMLQSIYKRDIL
jgi:type IV pilus assembly protein PilX